MDHAAWLESFDVLANLLPHHSVQEVALPAYFLAQFCNDRLAFGELLPDVKRVGVHYQLTKVVSDSAEDLTALHEATV